MGNGRLMGKYCRLMEKRGLVVVKVDGNWWVDERRGLMEKLGLMVKRGLMGI